MMLLRQVINILAAYTSFVTAQNTTIDLGYAIYQGTTNATSGITAYRGIRYAQPPVGDLRWQLPRRPAPNRATVIQATQVPYQCPQQQNSISNTSQTAARDNNGGRSSEDCLFLSVQGPANASNLPVFVWIHGGGYGAGNGSVDLSRIIAANGNGFVGVAIQYRLGAFGFLSSDEVSRNGVVNAGIHDQKFALQWVQDYIHLFGGNSSQVTIGGQSAGGGSVMLLDMAYGGTLGTSLFRNVFAASPYLPMQYEYRDWVPSQSYYALATAAGCPPIAAYGNSSQTIFQCLQNVNMSTLIQASQRVSASGTYGTWGFLPVTDGSLVLDLPSQQLLRQRVNGQNMLVGNNANEGFTFVSQTIRTIDDLVAWLRLTFPLFSNGQIAQVLQYYPSSNASADSATLFSTDGITGPTAVNQSDLASGQQQRANNIYAETTFVCPSYWMAQAYTADQGRKSYRYQYSVPPGLHGSESSAYFGNPAPNQGADFSLAFMQILGSFVISDNPSISNAVATGMSSNGSSSNAASNWPPYTAYAPYQINLNQTGGMATQVAVRPGVNVTETVGSGLRNDLSLVNAQTWEGGRGQRCDFWRSLGVLVPE